MEERFSPSSFFLLFSLGFEALLDDEGVEEGGRRGVVGGVEEVEEGESCIGWVGGWVGEQMSCSCIDRKVEENKAVRTRYCELGA